ncbi:hypothetical protein SGLAM104S_09408 [Streptomyces glaucescens]
MHARSRVNSVLDPVDMTVGAVPDTVAATACPAPAAVGAALVTVNLRRAATPARTAGFPQVSPRRATTRYRGVPFPHMILVAALEVPWYRRTS